MQLHCVTPILTVV